MSDRNRKRWRWIAQVLVSAGLAALVLRQLDLRQARALAASPRALAWLPLAVVLFNLSKLAAAVRLNVYQRHGAIRVSEADNLRLYYAGMFLNLCLPGGIGGDGYKIVTLSRRLGAPVKTLLAITLLDRASGLLTLLAMLGLLAPLLGLPWATAAAGAALLLAACLGHRRLLRMSPANTAFVLGLGLAVQLLQLACMAALLASLQVGTGHWPAYLALFLASSVMAALPLSWGGLGAREVTFLYGLHYLQVPATPGVVAASGFFAVTLLSSLPGALFLGPARTLRGHRL